MKYLQAFEDCQHRESCYRCAQRSHYLNFLVSWYHHAHTSTQEHMHLDSLTHYCLHLHTYQPGVQYEGKMMIVRLEATQCIRPVAAMVHEASLQGVFWSKRTCACFTCRAWATQNCRGSITNYFPQVLLVCWSEAQTMSFSQFRVMKLSETPFRSVINA